MNTPVTTQDIINGLLHIGAEGKRLVVHSSLSSLGRVRGGADAIVDALLAVAETVIVPTFTFSPAAIPPAGDRPVRNGADYETDRLGDANPTPFTPDLPAAKSMGMVPETLRRRRGAVRSLHPLSSFAAIGADAGRYVDGHAFDDPMLPLRRLHENGGYVLMLGTALTSCTAIHLGECYAGRRPFIRWAKLADGRVCRAWVGGCSDGFGKLEPWLEPVGHATVGQACLRMFSMATVTETTVRRLTADPHALVCHARCRRCLDAAAGGPEAA